MTEPADPSADLPAEPPGVATPRGYLRTPAEAPGVLRWAANGWQAAGEALPGQVTADDVARLRPFAGLRVEWLAAGEHETVLDLAAAGVPLYASEVPGWVREADPELAELLTAWEPDAGEPAGSPGTETPDEKRAAVPGRARADGTPGPLVGSVADLRREEHSVRLRRHGLRSRAGRTSEAGRTGEDGGPLVSVVMSSMRPHLLGAALEQIARQRHVRVEVLVGLHGATADDERVRRAVQGYPLPLTVVEADAATPFGEVLNRAAATAGGDYLAKWDDDDWYGPEHLADLLLAKEYATADVVGTAAEFFYLEPLRATIRRTDYTSEVGNEHVAGGTILLDIAKFREIGGFSPLPGGVDADLLKRIHAENGRIYRTHGLGYVLRRSLEDQHTWQLPLAHFLRVATNQWRGFRPSLIMETPSSGQPRGTQP
ncbi:glycosyltransferase [Streptosporangium soli]|nr:glycosyltransferase [Streptosporangium sp. KLBMP 9127]